MLTLHLLLFWLTGETERPSTVAWYLQGDHGLYRDPSMRNERYSYNTDWLYYLVVCLIDVDCIDNLLVSRSIIW